MLSSYPAIQTSYNIEIAYDSQFDEIKGEISQSLEIEETLLDEKNKKILEDLDKG